MGLINLVRLCRSLVEVFGCLQRSNQDRRNMVVSDRREEWKSADE